jgi:toxin ParE1/3/4
LRVRWTKRAERDLDEIAKYIGQDSPAAAARVILELIDQVEVNLPVHPAIGRPGRVVGTRELLIGRLPYVVPYRVRENDIEILRVLHTSRRLPIDP